MVIGLALIVSGAIVLYALRRALWRRLEEDGEPEAPPVERVHYVGPEDDAIDTPLDDGVGEYGSRPIYVPPERGTVYVSRGVDRD
ncbi:hypothetical protein ACTMTJ_31230 [Phytohabitans sp. LJ34]|uniref:hypothetical protein n=1 Tax=Phytohabitans sp. LJ34 TaxID=3452217 RepID=UPI003F8B73C0